MAKGVHTVERLLTLAGAATLPEAARQSIRLLAEQVRDRCPNNHRPHFGLNGKTATSEIASNTLSRHGS